MRASERLIRLADTLAGQAAYILAESERAQAQAQGEIAGLHQAAAQVRNLAKELQAEA